MTDVLSQPAAHALARALGHFVWQGAALALVTVVLFRLFRASASARYLVGVTGLAAMMAAPVITFVILANGSQPVIDPTRQVGITTSLTSAIVPATLAITTGEGATLSTQIDWLAALLLAWMLGAAAFTLRLTGGWIVARRFATRAVQPASEQISDMVRQLAIRMNVGRAIAIVESAAVSVPIMIGWLKPTIVLPIAALAGLNPAQVEALIAHEMAHVKRHDYLVNLLQSTIEALLFYHPAVWWLSRRVRADRELCCDDLAVRVCDRLVYATALTDLASLSSPGLALAATDGDLLGRVRRILGRGQTTPATWPGATPLLAMAFVAAVVVPATFASATPSQHPATVAFTATGEESGAITTQTTPQTTPTPTPTPSSSATPKPTTSPEPSAADQDALKKKLAWEEAARKQLLDTLKTIDEQRTVEAGKLASEQQLIERMQVADVAARQAQRDQLKAQAEISATTQAVQMAALRDDLRAAEVELERAKTLAEKGVVSAQTVRSMEEQVGVLQRQLEQVQTAQAKSVTQPQDPDAVAAQYRKMLTERRLLVAPPLDPAAPVQAKDVMSITITGEPDLPAIHVVAEDGTIRLPFVGSIKVAGLTAAQAREAVGKRLSEKKVGSVDQVTVKVSRFSR